MHSGVIVPNITQQAHVSATCSMQGDDPELEAIRQRRMQQMMAQQGGGQVACSTSITSMSSAAAMSVCIKEYVLCRRVMVVR